MTPTLTYTKKTQQKRKMPLASTQYNECMLMIL